MSKTDNNTESRKLGLWAFLLVFLMIACAVPLLTSDHKAAKDVFQLSDGRTIQLEAITYGTNHPVQQRIKWKEWLRPKLPTPMRDWLGPRKKEIGTSTIEPALIPWLSIDKNVSGASLRWGSFKIVCDSGECFPISSRGSGNTLNGRSLTHPFVHVFPRRDRYFSITGSVDQIPWSLRVENPIFNRTYKEWTTSPIPATNKANGLEFVLQPSSVHTYTSGQSISPRLDVFQPGNDVKGHYGYSWKLSDATGNHGYNLPTNEPAWKIDFTVYRQGPAKWTTNEYHEIKLTEFPDAGTHDILDINKTVNAHPVTRVWLGGSGRFEIKNGAVISERTLTPMEGASRSSSYSSSEWEMTWGVRNPWIMVETRRVPDHMRLSVHAIDARGEQINLNYSGGSGAGSSAILRQYAFKPSWTEQRKARKKNPKAPPLTTAELHPLPYTIRIAVQTNLITSFTVDPADLNHVNHVKPKK